MTKILIYSDGASRGNPGPAGAGAVLIGEDGGILATEYQYLGTATNNLAEYSGAILGLQKAIELGATQVTLRADSELLIKQLKGQYKVKNEGLKPLYQQALSLLKNFKGVVLEHVPREANKLADRAANQAIDNR
ncbi:MAG: ribonuclease HI family protein [Gemmatimonadaceae bacterium]|nr:ribonuclease HI family protein [Gloeobacterales cyanobacterium ES-bin-141]